MRRNPTKRAVAALIVATTGGLGVVAGTAAPAGAATRDHPLGNLVGGIVTVVDEALSAPVDASVDAGQSGTEAALQLAGQSVEIGLDGATGATASAAVAAGDLLQAAADLVLGPQGLDAQASLGAPAAGLDVDLAVGDGAIGVGVGGAGIRADLGAGVDLPAVLPEPGDGGPEVPGALPGGVPAASPVVGTPLPEKVGHRAPSGPAGPLAGALPSVGANVPPSVNVPDDLRLVSAEARLVADDAGGLTSSPLAALKAGTRLLPALLLLAAAALLHRRVAAQAALRPARVPAAG